MVCRVKRHGCERWFLHFHWGLPLVEAAGACSRNT